MSAFKDGATTIHLGGKDYKMVYSLAVMDKVQEKSDENGNFKFSDPHNIMWLVEEMIKAAAKIPDIETDTITAEELSDYIYFGNIKYVQLKLLEAMRIGNTGTAEPQEDDEADESDDVKKNQ